MWTIIHLNDLYLRLHLIIMAIKFHVVYKDWGKKIQAQNLSNCSQNIALGRVLLKLKEPSKFTPTPKKTDHSTFFWISQPLKIGHSFLGGQKLGQKRHKYQALDNLECPQNLNNMLKTLSWKTSRFSTGSRT